MKTSNTLRILAGLSFLIFFCPFLKTCTSHKVVIDEPIAGSQPPQQATEQTDSAHESNDGIINFYEWAIDDISDTFTRFKAKDLIDADFYLGLLVPAIIIVAFILSIASLYKKYRLAFIAATINAALLILVTLLIYNIRYGLEPLRYGYYLFVLNSIAIVFFSYKAKTTQKPAL